MFIEWNTLMGWMSEDVCRMVIFRFSTCKIWGFDSGYCSEWGLMVMTQVSLVMYTDVSEEHDSHTSTTKMEGKCSFETRNPPTRLRCFIFQETRIWTSGFCLKYYCFSVTMVPFQAVVVHCKSQGKGLCAHMRGRFEYEDNPFGLKYRLHFEPVRYWT
jgi:hypothetical protein